MRKDMRAGSLLLSNFFTKISRYILEFSEIVLKKGSNEVFKIRYQINSRAPMLKLSSGFYRNIYMCLRLHNYMLQLINYFLQLYVQHTYLTT